MTENAAPTRDSMTSSAGRGAAWSALAYASLGVAQLLLAKVLDDRVTEDEWGLAIVILTVIGLGRIFTESGAGPALIQRRTIERRHIETGFLISLGMGLAAFVVLALSAPLFASFFHSDELIPLIRVLSLTFIVQSAGMVAEGLLQRDLRLKELAVAEVVSIVVGYLGVGLLCALTGAGLWSLVWANVAQAAIKAALVLMWSRHPVSLHFDRDAGRDLAKFASGFTLAKIGNYAATNSDNMVIGNRLGKAQLGYYGRAFTLLAMPAMLFGQVVDRVLFPLMARIQDDKKQLALAFRRGVGAIASVTGPAGALMIVLAPEVLKLFGGDDWRPAETPLRVFSAGLMLRTGYKISDSLARSSGAVFKRARRQWIYAVAVVIGAFVGSQIAGITGASVGVLAALTLNYLMMADLSLQITGLGWDSFIAVHRRGVLLGLLTAGVASAVAIPVRHTGAHYLVTMLATGVATVALFGGLLVVKRDLVLGDVEWLLAGRRSKSASPSPTDGAPQAVAR